MSFIQEGSTNAGLSLNDLAELELKFFIMNSDSDCEAHRKFEKICTPNLFKRFSIGPKFFVDATKKYYPMINFDLDLSTFWENTLWINDDGSINKEKIIDWIKKAEKFGNDCNAGDMVLEWFGMILSYHKLDDEYGHLIDREILTNDKTHEMSEGFRKALERYYKVNITSNNNFEFKRSDDFKRTAENAEQHGYFRLASIYRRVSEDYKDQALYFETNLKKTYK